MAGLIRSLSYLAASADTGREIVVQGDSAARAALVEAFRKKAETYFLDSYFAAVDVEPALAMDSEKRRKVLDLFLLEKAAYEIGYEASNRPGWIAIPLAGFADIAERLTENSL